MIVLRVDDVGRKPGDLPEQGSDGDLAYFAQWRKAAGLDGLPCYYGVVPNWITDKGRKWLETNLQDGEQVAIHGRDHQRNVQPWLDQLQEARRLFFGAVAYIPPFNRYDDTVLERWRAAGGKYFFGGIADGVSQAMPRIRRNLVYLQAWERFYGHATDLVGRLRVRDTVDFPRVVTLHVPWDRDFELVEEIVDLVRDELVSFEEVEAWLQHKTIKPAG